MKRFLLVIALFSFISFMVGCGSNSKSMREESLIPATNVSADSSGENFVLSSVPVILKRPPAIPRYPLERKRLKVLALHSINSFFLYDGEEHGLEYELLQLYAKRGDFAIDIITVENYRQMYDSIATGNFDVAIGTLFVNAAMDSITPFSNTLYHSDVILATSGSNAVDSKKAGAPMNVIHHSPLHFWMHENDSVLQHVRDSINHLAADLSKELALEKVAKKEYPSLVVDKHDFLIMHSYFPHLTEHRILQREQPVAFAFNPHSLALKDHFNAWHAKQKHSSDYQFTLRKYNDHSAFIKEKLKYEMPVIRKGIISKYDSLIKQHAAKEQFDWKLIAAIIHQESRFRPHIVSPVGAYGLMQLMPSVAKTYKINFTKLASPDLNIAIGTRYFRWIYNHFDKPEFTEEDKIKFSLAAYNAGIGHIFDARALAVKYKMNPNVWSDNVEVMLLNKGSRKYYTDPVVKYGHCRGYETRVYVRNIMQYYEHYLNFLPVAN
ncbi:transglycosylase SLT domain-containing protein [Chryseolinea sp. H1M3-3]|uniref:transglycosylase SLT domain-containing protein n=1 Tax=Chryseolinea sp. H1M3-3 TaxID=3034144 RepID=UPI0023EBBDB2|nr:transglycosylase SLT domain-containing protein [Chryseolinea sp. H1M3-3]